MANVTFPSPMFIYRTRNWPAISGGALKKNALYCSRPIVNAPLVIGLEFQSRLAMQKMMLWADHLLKGHHGGAKRVLPLFISWYSPVGRALALGARSRAFKPRYPDHLRMSYNG